MPKVECPICHVKGFLQIRGKSARIQHYKGIIQGRKIYEYHKIPKPLILENGSKILEATSPNSSLNHPETWGRGLAWSRLRDLGSRDPGSNPGDPTNSFVVFQIKTIFGFVSKASVLRLFFSAIVANIFKLFFRF